MGTLHDDLDDLRTSILHDIEELGDIADLQLISDQGEFQVICRLKPATSGKKQLFAARFGGIAIGDSVFFKVERPHMD